MGATVTVLVAASAEGVTVTVLAAAVAAVPAALCDTLRALSVASLIVSPPLGIEKVSVQLPSWQEKVPPLQGQMPEYLALLARQSAGHHYRGVGGAVS